MILEYLTSNRLLNLGLCSWIAAQFIKTFIFVLKHKTFRVERLTGAGGMPSAHSALGASVAVGTAQQYGISSAYFALALTFALIIMYDAMGVRFAAGRHARAINMIVKRLDAIAPEKDAPLRQSIEELQESLGHRPSEVVWGALLGIFMAVISVKL